MRAAWWHPLTLRSSGAACLPTDGPRNREFSRASRGDAMPLTPRAASPLFQASLRDKTLRWGFMVYGLKPTATVVTSRRNKRFREFHLRASENSRTFTAGNSSRNASSSAIASNSKITRRSNGAVESRGYSPDKDEFHLGAGDSPEQAAKVGHRWVFAF